MLLVTRWFAPGTPAVSPLSLLVVADSDLDMDCLPTCLATCLPAPVSNLAAISLLVSLLVLSEGWGGRGWGPGGRGWGPGGRGWGGGGGAADSDLVKCHGARLRTASFDCKIWGGRL